MTAFAGVIPILATPFRNDESLDLESWQRPTTTRQSQPISSPART